MRVRIDITVEPTYISEDSNRFTKDVTIQMFSGPPPQSERKTQTTFRTQLEEEFRKTLDYIGIV